VQLKWRRTSHADAGAFLLPHVAAGFAPAICAAVRGGEPPHAVAAARRTHELRRIVRPQIGIHRRWEHHTT
jgi:hypothetical protein